MKINLQKNNGFVHGQGILTGLEIYECVNKNLITIDPFNVNQLNPNSYNLRIGNKLKVYDWENMEHSYIDSHSQNAIKEIEIPETGFVLQPNRLYIGSTIERTATDHFIPVIDGRSSGGRMGLLVHVCAGYGDIGFDGTWTLEIVAIEPLKIYPGDELAQVTFFTPSGDTRYKYRGRYYKQNDPTESKFSLDKTSKSLATEAIESYELEKYVNKILNKYGTSWFSVRGYNLYNIDCSFDLYENETVCESDDNNIYYNNAVIGRMFEVDGKKIYIRRNTVNTKEN